MLQVDAVKLIAVEEEEEQTVVEEPTAAEAWIEVVAVLLLLLVAVEAVVTAAVVVVDTVVTAVVVVTINTEDMEKKITKKDMGKKNTEKRIRIRRNGKTLLTMTGWSGKLCTVYDSRVYGLFFNCAQLSGIEEVAGHGRLRCTYIPFWLRS